MRSIPILGLLVLTLANPALASDGVLEINQTCATQSGCFAGDTAGFPVTIAASGSYRLTSNLVIPDPFTGAIAISIKNVIVDLNAFSILGQTVCATGICVPTGSGDGISSIQENVSVRNGSVVGMGDQGVRLGGDARIDDVLVKSNGGLGVFVDAASIVSNSLVRSNGGAGIVAAGGSRVVANVVTLNGSTGINLVGDATDNVVIDNVGIGIQAAFGSKVIGNMVYSNSGIGMSLSGGSSYGGNTIDSNAGGTVSGGVAIATNVCNGDTICP